MVSCVTRARRSQERRGGGAREGENAVFLVEEAGRALVERRCSSQPKGRVGGREDRRSPLAEGFFAASQRSIPSPTLLNPIKTLAKSLVPFPSTPHASSLFGDAIRPPFLRLLRAPCGEASLWPRRFLIASSCSSQISIINPFSQSLPFRTIHFHRTQKHGFNRSAKAGETRAGRQKDASVGSPDSHVSLQRRYRGPTETWLAFDVPPLFGI